MQAIQDIVAGLPLLSVLLLLPLVGALVIGLFCRTEQSIKRTALAISILTFVVSLPLYA